MRTYAPINFNKVLSCTNGKVFNIAKIDDRIIVVIKSNQGLIITYTLDSLNVLQNNYVKKGDTIGCITKKNDDKEDDANCLILIGYKNKKEINLKKYLVY